MLGFYKNTENVKGLKPPKKDGVVGETLVSLLLGFPTPTNEDK
jgi:hypothetical protein